MLRPYPSGGAIHELEFYLAVRACESRRRASIHYRSHEHALTRIDGAETPAAEMLEDCASAWGQPGRPPQVLVVLASRLPRLAWKYAGIAYKISLMNAGVAIQSLHLVATDLGLAGSAARRRQSELFAARPACRRGKRRASPNSVSAARHDDSLQNRCRRSLARPPKSSGVFTGAGIDLTDGFIHLSTGAQARRTAQLYFNGQGNLVLVAVDGARLGDALKYEPSRDGDLFPHLYGPLPLTAVLSVQAAAYR